MRLAGRKLLAKVSIVFNSFYEIFYTRVYVVSNRPIAFSPLISSGKSKVLNIQGFTNRGNRECLAEGAIDSTFMLLRGLPFYNYTIHNTVGILAASLRDIK